MIRRSAIVIGVVALAAVSLRASARADEAAAPSLLGDFLHRSTLTGDWLGARTDLARKGITFDVSLTQIGQGVVDGGKDGTWEYGGRALMTGNLDTGKLGLWPGGFLTLELEGNWSDAVNGKTGALMPANTNQLFPLPVGDNFAVPNVSFAQFLSHYAGVIFGKLDTMSGDANEFAHGKGDTQFFNTAMSINPVALVVPYSTLGGGVIVLPTKDPDAAIIKFLVVSATGKSTTTGFEDLDSDNLIFTGEGRMRTDFFGLTGHQLLGAFYSNKTYNSIDQRLGFVVENRALEKSDDTWAVYYNFDQFLYETDRSAGRGIGLFGRFGASEGNPNPAQYFFSAGVGGKGIIPHRDLDRFGVGSYYIIIQNPTFQRPLVTRSLLRDEWGVEVFYNIALTPWMLLTPDLQVIGPAQKRRLTGLLQRESIDTATVLGMRLQLIF
jgi:porin